MKKMISIVIPCYNEEKNIINFYNEILKIIDELKHYNFELIFSVDPSTDNSFEVVKSLNSNDKKVHYIFMSRRFGKEASMRAGLLAAKGDFVCIMDVDLQDPPNLIPKMIEILENGEYDSVATRRVDRKGEPFLKSIFSNLFYKIINKSCDLDLKPGARDFRMMNRKMVNSVLESKEKNQFLKAIYGFTGYKTKWLEFNNIKRNLGKSKWSIFKLFSYSMTCIFGFTKLPLIIIFFLGIIMILLSTIFFAFILIYSIILNNHINDLILIFNFIMFFCGIQTFINSILCQYMYSIYVEVKQKPSYIIAESDIKCI